MRYITFLPTEKQSFHRFKVSTEMFMLLSVCFVYGLGGGIIDEYRQLFSESAIMIMNNLMNDHEDDDLRTLFCASSAFNTCIRHALRSFREELDPGGIDDAFLNVVVTSAYHSITQITAVKPGILKLGKSN